jgi:hypothetical protein
MSISAAIENFTPNFLLDNLTDDSNTVITMNKIYIRVGVMNKLPFGKKFTRVPIVTDQPSEPDNCGFDFTSVSK